MEELPRRDPKTRRSTAVADTSSDSKDIFNTDNLNVFGDGVKTYNEDDFLKVKPRLQAVRQRALKLLETTKNIRILNETSDKKSAHNISSNQSKSINASDLVADNTIVLQSPTKSITKHKNSLQNKMLNQENKISFEPSEITGRSTLFKQTDLLKNKEDVTVDDILASSFCDNIRRMTLNSKKTSGISSLNSLRTADISNYKFSESFQPAEHMTSQLLRDELSWENDYLPMPSSEAIAQDMEKRGIELQNVSEQSAKSIIDFSNISEVGKYFQKRSEQIECIISPNVISPPKRNPVKLVDKSFKDFNKANNTISATKTCNQIIKETENQQQKPEDKSYVLTMSAVENVLKQLNLDDLLNVETKLPYNRNSPQKTIERSNEESEKENISPTKKSLSENDTVTFTESLLNVSNSDNFCNKNTGSMKSNFGESEISSLDEVRSAKSPSKESNIFFSGGESYKDVSRKRPRPNKRSLTPEPPLIAHSLSSTLLNNRNKNENFLSIKTDIRPPVSPIRTKTPKKLPKKYLSPNSSQSCSMQSEVVTPEKYQLQNLSPISSSQSSTSTTNLLKSPDYFNVTTHSEHQYLRVSKDKGSKYSPSGSKLRSKSSSPVNLGALKQQYTAGSLMSAKSRCNSQCSTSSEFSHRQGQSLPIKATANQCCFGSVKLRIIVKKKIGIRNVSIKRLCFKVAVEGPGFQIDMENNSVITLQGQECRSISISFCPTVLGAATGKLNFSSPYDGWPVDKVILLQGYGGHASIKVRDFLKGPVGPPYINMGELQELSQPLIKSFSIYNRGPLSGFAIVNLNSTGLTISNLCECIEIEPKKAFLPPDSIVKFRITFRPRRSDIKKILSKICDVMTIANIRIVTGDEPTRQRIRNIIKIMNEVSSNERTNLPELTQTKLSTCWSALPDEIMLNELNSFVENSENALELANGFCDWEAVLTISHCLMDITKNTSKIVFPDLDETILFRTMICANSDKNSDNENEIESLRLVESWTVKPNFLRFDQSTTLNKAKFTITSYFKTDQYFEITSNYKNLFNIHPKEGKLLPEEAISIEVILRQNKFPLADNINIIIYFENEKINVPVVLKENN